MGELQALLTLCAVPFFGPAKIKALLNEMSAQEFMELEPSELQAIGLKPAQIAAISQPDLSKIEQALSWAEQDNCHLIAVSDESYPALLKEIHDPPPVLYVVGNAQVLHEPQVAIVGSRHASQMGLKTAYALANELAASSICVSSGLALGIDGRAHQGALDAKGSTIAVMATGADIIYPKRHRFLAQQIAQDGALVFENPLGTAAFAGAFPRRNRIISGLSLGCVIVEAAQKSGSLITARLAMEQGREVFAVPGAINNPMADGCNALIQQGAKLISKVADIIEELPSCSDAGQEKLNNCVQTEQLSLPFCSLLDSVAYEGSSIDEIAHNNQLSVAEVTAQLIELELEGLVLPIPGGYMKLRRDC